MVKLWTILMSVLLTIFAGNAVAAPSVTGLSGTGDDISLRFDHVLPVDSDTDVVSLDFLPLVKYPYGGKIFVQLYQDDNNYYEISNTDGYDPGTVTKVVNGNVVDSADFTGGYSQNTSYQLDMTYSPDSFQADAFGDLITLTGDATDIVVEEIRIKLTQQDAYVDNISFTDGATTSK